MPREKRASFERTRKEVGIWEKILLAPSSLPNDASIYFFFNQIVYMTVEGALKEARAEIEGPEKNTILFIPNVIPIIFSRSISRIIQIIEE